MKLDRYYGSRVLAKHKAFEIYDGELVQELKISI